MPCYLFTWHTYGSWLPDRPQGYVHWSRGLQRTSLALAQSYRKQQKDSQAVLTPVIQEELIVELIDASIPISCRLHGVATEASHLHLLASWRDIREPKQLRRSLRRSMSVRLNQSCRRKWFSQGGDIRRVTTRKHFNHLAEQYLPNHRGWKWCEKRGKYK